MGTRSLHQRNPARAQVGYKFFLTHALEYISSYFFSACNTVSITVFHLLPYFLSSSVICFLINISDASASLWVLLSLEKAQRLCIYSYFISLAN